MILQKTIQKLHVIRIGAAVLLCLAAMFNYAPAASAQTTCGTTTTPSTAMGQVTQTVNVATAGTYRVWSRIKAPNTTANSYYLQVDGGCAYNVGDNAIAANTWTWVNYQNAVSTNVINVTLTAGTHTLKYTGKEADVQLDRVIMTADLACVPTGTGDNCATADTAGPTTALSAPAANATVSGQTTVTATASDPSGIAQLEFYLDTATTPFRTITGAGTYSFAWDTTAIANGSHTIKVKATDTAGNATTTGTTVVNVSNAAVPAAVPLRIDAGATAPFTDSTGVVWQADTYFVGGLTVDRGAIAIANTTADRLYQTERYQMTGYNIPIANGTYKIRLHLAETTGSGCTAVGCRIMSAAAEGAALASNLDVFATAGANAALIREATVTVADGTLNLSFSATANLPMLSALEVLPATTADITPPAATVSVTPASLATGSNVTASATASDNVAVTKVEFYENGVLKATDTTAPYTGTWAATTAGSRAVTAKAFDAAGNSAVSTAVTYTATTTTALRGDVNGDSKVNAIDFSLLVSRDGQSYPAADFDKDGVVGAADLALLLANWTW